MKVRNGFVSNSSSSSFIISADDFPTVRSLAKYMLKKKIQETIYYDADEGVSSEDDKYIKFDEILIERLNNIDENDPISFPSCNYDTYIRRVGNYYLVATCNNTDWDLDEYRYEMSNELRNDLHKLIEYYQSIGDFETVEEINNVLEYNYEFSHFGIDFYDLNKEVKGVEIFKSCPKCSEYLWNTQRFGIICPDCDTRYKRKDKLDKINLSE
jgi:hypothetical protein